MNYITYPNAENQLHFLQFTQGNESSLQYIYQRLYKPMLYYSRTLIQDEFTAHSIVQDAFLKLWSLRSRMQSMLHIFRFLRLNITWQCRSWYKSTERSFLQKLIYTDAIADHAVTSLYPLPGEAEEQEAAYKQRLQRITHIIPYLPSAQQTMVTLYFKDGLTYSQIARRFQTSGPAVSKEVQKGLDQLKTILQVKQPGKVMRPYPKACRQMQTLSNAC